MIIKEIYELNSNDIEPIVYKSCMLDAKTPIKLSQCILNLLNARDFLKSNQKRPFFATDFLTNVKNLFFKPFIETVSKEVFKKRIKRRIPLLINSTIKNKHNSFKSLNNLKKISKFLKLKNYSNRYIRNIEKENKKYFLNIFNKKI